MAAGGIIVSLYPLHASPFTHRQADDMTRSEKQKIIAAGAMGAFAGFIVGVTLLDSGILGAVLVGAPAAYFMNLRLGRQSPEEYTDTDIVTLSEGTDGQFKADVSPVDDICKAGRDAVPVMENFLIACWNLLMKGILAVGAMRFFRKYPWLFAVVIGLMLVLLFPVGLVFAFAALSAWNAQAQAADDFIVIPGRDMSAVD